MYLNECYFNLNKLFIFHFYIKRFIILLVKVWLGSSIFRIELNYWMSYEWFNLSYILINLDWSTGTSNLAQCILPLNSLMSDWIKSWYSATCL